MEPEWNLSVRCLIHTKTVNIKMRLQMKKLVQCRMRMQSRHQDALANLVATWYSVILICIIPTLSDLRRAPSTTSPWQYICMLDWGLAKTPILWALVCLQSITSINVHHDLLGALWERKGISAQVSSGGIQCQVVAMVFPSCSWRWLVFIQFFTWRWNGFDTTINSENRSHSWAEAWLLVFSPGTKRFGGVSWNSCFERSIRRGEWGTCVLIAM